MPVKGAETADAFVAMRYQTALASLKHHVADNGPADLKKLEAEFNELGFYQMSFMLSFYCKMLDAVDDEGYNTALSMLAILEKDAEFTSFLAEEPQLGTLDGIKSYVLGCQAEHAGDYVQASLCFDQCSTYRDSQVRKANLLENAYQQALAWFRLDTVEGYRKAHQILDGLGDYKASKAYNQKAMMLLEVMDDEIAGTVSASENGFAGPVAVTVSFDSAGKIRALTIGDEHFRETSGFGTKALEPAFAQQFIGLQAPVSQEDIDAITYATLTTDAVINAVNKAYEEFSAGAADAPIMEKKYSASGKGFNGPVQATVSFNAVGRITSLSIGSDEFKETPGLGGAALDPAFAEQFIGLQAPVAKEDIDAITYATITTNAVIEAVNAAYDKFLAE